MSTTAITPRLPARVPVHKIRLALLVTGLCLLAAWTAWYGIGYYLTPLTERPFHSLHRELKPSGLIGLRLGFFAAACFGGLYLYPLRKRWKPLQRIGKTRNWMDLHVFFGLAAPVAVTLHSSFKFQGLAGVAYWIMIAIVFSGIIGRYLYSQIPRSASAAELSLRELQQQASELAAAQAKGLFSAESLARAFALPSREQVEAMSVPAALWRIFVLDVTRPFRVAALRRTGMAAGERWLSLGGLLPGRHHDVEDALRVLKRLAWLKAKILFLNRAAEVFHLWHVIHRPFSWSFLILVAVHIVLVALMGYI